MKQRYYNTIYGSGGRKNPGRSLLALVTLCMVFLNLNRYGR